MGGLANENEAVRSNRFNYVNAYPLNRYWIFWECPCDDFVVNDHLAHHKPLQQRTVQVRFAKSRKRTCANFGMAGFQNFARKLALHCAGGISREPCINIF